MDIRILSSSNSASVIQTPWGDPADFIILDTYSAGDKLAALLKYKGCSEFDGKKILVFRGVTKEWLYSQISIDPHFIEAANGLPLCRFAPTAEGWELAKTICNLSVKNKKYGVEQLRALQAKILPT